MSFASALRAAGAALLGGAALGCGTGAPADVAPFSDDPLSARQGYMLALGVPEAWGAATSEVVVAVIDDGIEVDHPDLRERLWTNSGELPNGEDDDGNGFADDLHGWSFLENSGEVAPTGASANAGHGTAAAGIIGAATDNGLGVAACCPVCKLMALRARDFETTGNVMAELAGAVDYAVSQGAMVINISDGVPVAEVDPDERTAAEEAIHRAVVAGVVVVVSAGNDGGPSVRWPAVIPEVIAVAAVDWEGEPMPWTSHGPEVDLAAPGTFVLTTSRGGGYDYFNGTSAAAPIVAAAAAMLRGRNPSWSAAEIATRLRETATPAQTANHPETAGGLGAGIVHFPDAALP